MPSETVAFFFNIHAPVSSLKNNTEYLEYRFNNGHGKQRNI